MKVWLLNEGLPCSSSHRSAHPPLCGVRALTRVAPPPPHLAPDRRRQRNNTREQPLSTRLALENKKMKISRQTSNFSGVCGSALKCTGAHELHLLCTAPRSVLGWIFHIYICWCVASCLNSGRDIKAGYAILSSEVVLSSSHLLKPRVLTPALTVKP